MSLINVTGLTFAYDGSYENIFENVSFQIDTDWKLGFTGRNGRGKTTFLNLLMEKYPYTGEISASVGFEYFPFEVPDKKLYTIDVIMGFAVNSEYWEIVRELHFLEVSDDVLYRPFETLSNGEQTKALLAALFLKENRFLLIDEPTNHLDAHAREIVSRYLNKKKGFILVSHDRAFLDGCIDHVLSINKTTIEIQKGNFSSWLENKALQDQFELSQNEKLKKDIRRLSEAARRTSEWSDTAESRKIGFDPSKVEKSITRRPTESAKAKKMMARSKAIQERQLSALDEKSKLLKNIEQNESLKLFPLKFHTDNLVTLDKVSVIYGERTVCEEVGFTVNSGDRVSLCGKNGCGKSSILKLICGEDIPHSGNVYKNNQLLISYVPQSTAHLSGSLTDYAERYGLDISLFFAMLHKLDLTRTHFEKQLEDFSEGQKKKVLIAGSLCTKAHLYVWDEPLNFIDVISRMQIENLILKHQPTLIFVEHDRAFYENIATKTICL